MLKTRKLYKEIEPYIEHKNAIVITGARQVGKTTLLKQFYNILPEGQKTWFDFENPLHQKIFEDIDYDSIFKRLVSQGLQPDKRKYVFIDEIQNFPEITKIIKYLIDHYKIKFFVTGSSSFYMKNLFPESLSGRKFVFNLYPLDFHEFLYFKGFVENIPVVKNIDLEKKSIVEFKKHEREFDEYLEYGGFPEVVLSKTRGEKKLIIENIFKSFFQKDILQLSTYQDIKEIRDLILLLARRIGSKLDITKIASELGVNRYKVYAHIEFLQAVFLIKLISVYTKSIDKKIAACKKVYFIDTGLVNQISKISEGELFENSVFNLLTNYGETSYYSGSSGKEIDFVLNNKMAFEVKLTATKHDLIQLKKLAEHIGIDETCLISKSFVKDTEHVIYPQFL